MLVERFFSPSRFVILATCYFKVITLPLMSGTSGGMSQSENRGEQDFLYTENKNPTPKFNNQSDFIYSFRLFIESDNLCLVHKSKPC